MRRATPDLRVDIVPSPVNFSVLEDASIDLFMSSHCLEHLPDPCPFMDGLWRVLRPGGLVFTEVPIQIKKAIDNFGRKREVPDLLRGAFHLIFFKESTFDRMMRNAGFE